MLARDETNARAHNNLGLLYLEQGNLDEAARSLQRAVSIDPKYPKARLNLGVVLMRQKRDDAAAAEFRAVLTSEPRNVDAMVNLALIERNASAPEAAKELLLRALTIAPRDPLAHYNLAVLYDGTGETRRALDHYRVFLEAAAPEHSAQASDVRARVAVLSRR